MLLQGFLTSGLLGWERRWWDNFRIGLSMPHPFGQSALVFAGAVGAGNGNGLKVSMSTSTGTKCSAHANTDVTCFQEVL